MDRDPATSPGSWPLGPPAPSDDLRVEQLDRDRSGEGRARGRGVGVIVVTGVAALIAVISGVVAAQFRSEAGRWESVAESAEGRATSLESTTSRLRDEVNDLSDQMATLRGELRVSESRVAELEATGTVALSHPGNHGSAPVETLLNGPSRLTGGLMLHVSIDSVSAVDGTTSEPRWSLACKGAEWLAPFPSEDPGVEVVRCGAEIVVIDVVAGVRQWIKPLPFDPDRSRVGSSSVVIQEDRAGVVVLDLATGEQRWRAAEAGSANVAAAAGRVYFSNDDGVFARDETTGAELWRFPIGTSGLIATPEAVYARTGHHHVHRLDPETGSSIASSAQDRDGFYFSDFVAVSDDVVVLRQATPESIISVFDATSAELLWQHRPGVPAGVAIASEAIVVLDSVSGVLSMHHLTIGQEIARRTGVFDLFAHTFSGAGNLDGWARLVANEMG